MDRKVSIIIPVYNSNPKLFDYCLQSVINQTYLNLEICLIDDGSDNKDTIDFCQKSMKKDKRILLYRQEHKGLSAARGLGIRKATGDYITFVDSDDCIHRQFVENLTTMIEKDNYDLAEISGKEVLDIVAVDLESKVQGKEYEIIGREKLMNCVVEDVSPPIGWSSWAKLYKTEILKKCYIVHEDVIYGQDVVTLAEYTEQCDRAIISNKEMYFYNKGNPNSVTAGNGIRKLAKCRFGLALVKIYKEKGNVYNYSLAKAIYIRMLLGNLIICEYKRYDNYQRIQKLLRQELWKYIRDILFNPNIEEKYKYLIALISTKPYYLLHLLKRGKAGKTG